MKTEPQVKRATESLTGARALAAGWVLLFHLVTFADPLWGQNKVFRAFAAQGYMGVDFFFVLSGFILALQYLGPLREPTRKPVARFLLLRLARIYPLHVLTMLGVALVALLGALVGKSSANPYQLSLVGGIANLLLVHSWGWLTTYSWNEPSWSISCEWFAYLCFPLIALTYGRIRRPAAAWLACILPLAALLVVLRLLGESTINQTLRFGILRISGEFLSGCGIFLLMRSGVAARLPSWSVFVSIALLGAALAFQITDPFAVFLFALLILTLVANPRTWPARFLATPVMVGLGEGSYSLYMVNQRIILWVNHVWPYGRAAAHSALFRGAAALGLAGSIVLVAWFTYRFVEQPGRRYARSYIDRWFPNARSQASLPGELRPSSVGPMLEGPLSGEGPLPEIETLSTRG